MESGDHRLSQFNPEACTTVETIDIIGTEWRLKVLYTLQDGEQRFNEIKASTDANSRTLSKTLDTLIEHDLVTKRTEEDAPIAVYYRLTPKGNALESVFDRLETWAQEQERTQSATE